MDVKLAANIRVSSVSYSYSEHEVCASLISYIFELSKKISEVDESLKLNCGNRVAIFELSSLELAVYGTEYVVWT